MKFLPGNRALGVFALTCATIAFAPADNAALTSGGSPSMMSAHPSVSMASEVVHVLIHADHVDTDCTFVFKNDGPECNVSMGFPDFGMWAYAESPAGRKSWFQSFRSYVDGKPVKTKLVGGKTPGEQWQVKLVPFEKNGTRVVREVYRNEMGGISDKYVSGAIVGAASYILHTGASWHRPIGSATIVFEFAPDAEISSPLEIELLNPKSSDKQLMQKLKQSDFVAVTGPVAPTVSGLVLAFQKNNWRPTKDDDILLLFRFSPKQLAKEIKQAGHRP